MRSKLLSHSARVAVSFLLFACATPAQCEPTPQPGIGVPSPRGYVEAMTSWDPDGPGPLGLGLVAAGQFTFESSLFAALGIWDGTRWQPPGTPPADRASAVTVFQGRLVAAFPGVIAAYDGTSWQTLATLSGGLALARTFALFQGNLVVGGSFTQINGVLANNIAQWTGAAWGALGTGVTGEVRALAVHTIQPTLGSGLYVGGSLTAAGGTTVYGLASWDGATWRMVARMHGDVHCMAVRIGQSALDSHLFVGGSIGHVGQAPHILATPGVARFQPATNTWSAMGTTFQGRTVRSLLVRGTGINRYEIVAGAAQTQFIAHRWNGTTWSPLGAATSTGDSATSLTVSGGQYVAGTSLGVSRFDDTSWTPIGPATPGFTGQVTAVLDDDGETIAGGTQLAVAGVPMHGIMRGSGAHWSAMGGGVAGPSGTVHALARLTNGDILAAGDFTVAGGGAGNRIARWTGRNWSPLGSGMDGTVRALLALPGGGVVAGGDFLTAGGVAVQHIAQWTNDGGANGAWAPLGNGTNAPVHALALLPDGSIIAGGDFTLAGSLVNVVNHIARWDGTSWQRLGVGTSEPVRDLAVLPAGDLVVSGQFVTAGGVPANGVARWSTNGWSAPYQSWGRAMEDVVVLPNGDHVFRSSPAVLRWRAGTVTSIAATVKGTVQCLRSADNGDLLVGGDFVGCTPATVAHGVVRLVAPCAARAIPYGSGCSSSTGPVVTTALQLPWLGSTYRARTVGIAPTGSAFDLLGLQATSVPLSVVHPSGAGCHALVADPVSQLLQPNHGAVTAQYVIPNDPVLLGASLRNQVVQLELGSAGLTRISSGNGLLWTIGRF